MRRYLSINLMLVFLTSVCLAAEKPPLNDQKTKESYSLGFEFGSNLKRYGVDIDREVLISAIQDGLEGKKPSLSAEEINTTLAQQRRRLATRQNMRLQEYATRNLESGKTFLEKNKTREGVITLQSGLQYKVLQEGTGASPGMTDVVTLTYRGTLIDGQEFDNSRTRKEPMRFPMEDVIKGWSQALQLMKAGSKWQIFVPPELAYGNRQSGRIPPNSTLIFEIELVAFQPQPPLSDLKAHEGNR